MIKRLDSSGIAQILKFNDRIEDYFPCDKGEWVQWLMENVDNPRVLIIGNKDVYLVAVDAVMKPLSDFVSILFCYSEKGFDKNMEVKTMLDDWAKERGASGIRFICEDISVFSKYGAKEKATYGGWDF